MDILKQKRYPTKRLHYVGSSAVLTIDQSHIRRLGIDEFTFFEERPIENGIHLVMRKLVAPQKEEEKADRRLRQGTLGKRFGTPRARVPA